MERGVRSFGLPLTPTLSPEGRGGESASGLELTAPASPLPSGERVRVRGSHGDPKIRTRARALRAVPTDAEARLWTQLRNRRLRDFRFARQYAIGPYFADFVCRDRWLVVELDGGQHSGSRSDEIRTEYMNSLGYSVLRFWNTDVLQGMDGVLTSILSVLENQPLPHLRYAPGNLDARPR